MTAFGAVADAWVEALIGLAGLGLFFFLVFLWKAVHAPFIQRDEARSELLEFKRQGAWTPEQIERELLHSRNEPRHAHVFLLRWLGQQGLFPADELTRIENAVVDHAYDCPSAQYRVPLDLVRKSYEKHGHKLRDREARYRGIEEKYDQLASSDRKEEPGDRHDDKAD